jgi:protein-tyrosine phosphatase
VFEARLEYLTAAYEEVDRVYGGMDRYLRDGIGVDDRTAHAIRELLLTGE